MGLLNQKHKDKYRKDLFKAIILKKNKKTLLRECLSEDVRYQGIIIQASKEIKARSKSKFVTTTSDA